MKRILMSIIALIGLAVSAAAQGCGPSNPNCVVPDRPFGDSTNSAANTRFVQSAIGSLNLLLSDGKIFVGNGSNIATGVTPTGAVSVTDTGVFSLAAPAFANPTGSVGLAAVNGTAVTAMRSDAAPALSQSIAPIWTGIHKWDNSALFGSGFPWCDVREKGALGNATGNDAPAFAACVTQVQSVGGGTVYVPPGVYCIKSVVSVANSGAVIFRGASKGGAMLTTCSNDNGILSIAAGNSQIKDMVIAGPDIRTTTNDTIQFATTCNCFIENVQATGGRHVLNALGGEYTIVNSSFAGAYGGSNGQVSGVPHLIRVAFDSNTPTGSFPAPSAIAAWTSAHAYTANTIVTLGGWYIQATTSGTSAGSSPALATAYGVNMTDNTVTWQLASPVGGCGLHIDGGTFNLSSVDGDHSGPFDYGVCIDNANGAGASAGFEFGVGSTFQALTDGIHGTVGSQLKVIGGIVGPGASTASNGVFLGTTWSGIVDLIGMKIGGQKIGINISTGDGASLLGNSVYPNAQTGATGIQVSGGLSGFAIGGNIFVSRADYGALANGVVIGGGAGDFISIYGNTCRGVTSQCVSNGATGTHQTSEAIGAWTFGPTGSGFRTIIDPSSSTAINVTGPVSLAFAHSYNGTSNAYLRQNSDNSGTLGVTANAAFHFGTNGSTTDFNIGSAHGFYSANAVGNDQGADTINLHGAAAYKIDGAQIACSNLSGASAFCSGTNAASLTGTLAAAQLGGMSAISNVLGGDVAMNNTANYFDGPSIAQGTTGTWQAAGTVTVRDSATSAVIFCKLWDGTTVISSSSIAVPSANADFPVALSGSLASPAANIRISCRDISATTGVIKFNATGNSKDSTISAIRIN